MADADFSTLGREQASKLTPTRTWEWGNGTVFEYEESEADLRASGLVPSGQRYPSARKGSCCRGHIPFLRLSRLGDGRLRLRIGSDTDSASSDEEIRRRLIAVLNYDGIQQAKQCAHLANACGISRSKARRILTIGTIRHSRSFFELAHGLKVDYYWLWKGDFSSFDPRTWRIMIQEIKGYPKEDVDLIMRLFVGSIAGHHKARNLLLLASSGQMRFTTAARLL